MTFYYSSGTNDKRALNSNGEGVLIDATGNTLSLKDGSDRFASRFWYDELGRLCLSQNAKQFNIGNYLEPKDNTKKAYSYTLYDAIGRIIEVGEVITSENVSLPLSGKYESQVTYKKMQDFVTTNTRRQITNTYYDEPAFTVNWENETIQQTNLRTRVASVTYQESLGTSYDQASHYSYDVHGNVKNLIVEIAQTAGNSTLNTQNSKLVKRLDYDYDLVSGKVNSVYYQANKTDQFIHRYEYDSDNRITKVFTSKDGVIWDNDAKYQYYAHGPLARTVTGELAVETQNFAYTIQGWIKGLNGENFSYALGYNSTDYASIGTANNLATDIATGKDLYNGNIATWTSNNKQLSTANWTQQFEYDQLNRIKSGTSYNYTVNGTLKPDAFKNSYQYDPNGNITNLMRYSRTGDTLFDNLHYNYENTTSSSNYKQNTNKLRSVDEPISLTGLRADDIDDQNGDNYKYDEIGNLVFDDKEEIEKIEWNLSGKVKSITRKVGSTKADLVFGYNPIGLRISKTVITKTATPTIITTFYVRDATGNIMATYDNTTLQEHDIYGNSCIGTAKTTGKAYALTDHLGNVRTVLSDKGLVLTATDFYPFGMVANSFTSVNYAFGYNGQMKTLELNPSHTTAEYWEYDGRLGRRWNIDPMFRKYAHQSPYSVFNNNPITFSDYSGLEGKKDGDKKLAKKQIREVKSKIKELKKAIKDKENREAVIGELKLEIKKIKKNGPIDYTKYNQPGNSDYISQPRSMLTGIQNQIGENNGGGVSPTVDINKTNLIPQLNANGQQIWRDATTNGPIVGDNFGTFPVSSLGKNKLEVNFWPTDNNTYAQVWDMTNSNNPVRLGERMTASGNFLSKAYTFVIPNGVTNISVQVIGTKQGLSEETLSNPSASGLYSIDVNLINEQKNGSVKTLEISPLD